MMAKYIMNLRTKKLHRLPSQERCNVDAIPRRFRYRYGSIASLDQKLLKKCRYCFSEGK